ncbi:MAG: hypothetical protein EPO21_14005 [Chloroflexota bacterium]|nr:MAG: hypothetical protein EPO21_14005 [Chloroflexota bacterium]
MIIAANIVLPVGTSPIEHGAVVIEGERIKAVGSREGILATYQGRRLVDFGHAIIMPGLVNAHTHLEYTAQGPLNEPRPFLPWIQSLGRTGRELSREDLRRSATHGAQLLLKAGVTCVGDIVTFGPGLEAALEVGLRGVSYIEALGLRGEDLRPQMAAIDERLRWAEQQAEGSSLRVGISPHSVYVTSTKALVDLGRLADDQQVPVAMHLAETRAECQFVRTGDGDLAEMLKVIADHDLIASGGCGISPVEHVARCGLTRREQTLMVHCVHLAQTDIALLATSGVGIALCPRSNFLLQVGEAPVLELFQAGVRIGLGTDSLASNLDLDLFAEMRALRELCQQQAHTKPEPAAVPTARELLRSATLTGAEILGMDGDVGSLEPGKLADLAVVRLPEGDVGNPEEWLVTKAQGSDILCTMIGGEPVYQAVPHLPLFS